MNEIRNEYRSPDARFDNMKDLEEEINSIAQHDEV